jgi:hypothetical protein
MSVIAFLLAFAAFACLALAMPRHFQAVIGSKPASAVSLSLRVAGWLLITASLAPCIAWLGSPVGIVAWFGVLNAAALLAAFGLTWRKRSRASTP